MLITFESKDLLKEFKSLHWASSIYEKVLQIIHRNRRAAKYQSINYISPIGKRVTESQMCSDHHQIPKHLCSNNLF